MKNLYFLIVLILGFTIVSCSEEDTSTSNVEIEGTWKTPCYVTGSYYATDTITISGTSVVLYYNYYADSSCSTDNYTVTYNFSGYSEGSDMVFSSYGTSGGSGKQFTMTHNYTTETPQNSSEVSWYNNNSYCGETDWALDIANDTTGLTCGSSTRWSANATIYGLYLLDGDSLFGSFSTSTYPSSVSTGDNDTFTKQ